MRVFFTCGGTAGHVNPVVALAQVFQTRNSGCEVLFVGTDGGTETRLVSKEGYLTEAMAIINLRRSLFPASISHNVRTLLSMNKSRRRASAILGRFQLDLVMGTGGYASFLVVKTAAKRGIPTVVHEPDAVPGLTAKILSKVVGVVVVGFEESRSHYDDPGKVVVTDTPVRIGFLRYTRKEARVELGPTDDWPLVLSVWGSLGAEMMNCQMAECIALECRDGAPFHHIRDMGRDYQAALGALQGSSLANYPEVDVWEYIYDMPPVMVAANLVLCRAGASTIVEIIAIVKPAVLVPSPNVMVDHQTKNVRVLTNVGGAVPLPEGEPPGEKSYVLTTGLLSDTSRREAMSRILWDMAVSDAAEQIYQTPVHLMEKRAN